LNFLDEFLEWTKNAESPESYFLWAAISAVSAVMRDNFQQIWEHGKLYPNTYILIVGPPAIGKQLPMKLAGGLIRKVKNTRLVEGSASIQAIIKMLGTYETGGQKGASCLIYTEELSSFYVKDQGSNDLLTDLYDFHEVWDRTLISWSASLKNVCVSLFAGSNETLLKGILDDRAMFGGLLRRTLLIMESKKRYRKSLVRKGTEESILANQFHQERLLQHLMNLSKLKGEIVFEEDAIALFEHWYDVQWEPTESNPRTKTGIEGTMKTHVKKVAMILAMCEPELDLVIRKRHVEIAIDLCVNLYNNYKLLASETGKSPTAHPAAILIRLLSLSPGYALPRKIILRRNIGEFNIAILDETVAALTAADLIIEISESNEVSYRLTSNALEIYGIIPKKETKV
jgi:hypothetical protein